MISKLNLLKNKNEVRSKKVQSTTKGQNRNFQQILVFHFGLQQVEVRMCACSCSWTSPLISYSGLYYFVLQNFGGYMNIVRV